jgi:hypothetical protein
MFVVKSILHPRGILRRKIGGVNPRKSAATSSDFSATFSPTRGGDLFHGVFTPFVSPRPKDTISATDHCEN